MLNLRIMWNFPFKIYIFLVTKLILYQTKEIMQKDQCEIRFSNILDSNAFCVFSIPIQTRQFLNKKLRSVIIHVILFENKEFAWMIFSMTAAMSKNFKCILKAFKSFCKCNDIQILIYKSEFIVGDACKLKFDSNILRSSKRLSTLIFYLRKNVI